MHQKKLLLAVGLLILITIGLVIGQKEVSSDAEYCRMANGACSIDDSGVKIDIQFAPASIPLETELDISMMSASPLSIRQAWVEGINMYMGRIPVQFESNDGMNWHAPLFLGMCSEPDMQWQLIVEVTGNGGKSLFKRFIFTTLH